MPHSGIVRCERRWRHNGETHFVHDGFVGNAARFKSLEHHVDTGGVSDHVFALFYVPGLTLMPRLSDIPDGRLACLASPVNGMEWKTLSLIMEGPNKVNDVPDRWGVTSWD
ncbi:MAG: Tn3 family transposase [Paracoccaceae bacterium]|nr:Tn3 family transposase [Paracoccaceae bacterium]